MGFFGFGRKKATTSKDPREREAAVRAMPVAEQGTLCEMALADNDAQVRIAAAAKIVDAELLEHLARSKDPAVARLAKDKLQASLLDQIKRRPLAQARGLLDQVDEQSALVILALQAEDRGVRQHSFEKLLALPEVSQRSLVTVAIQDETGVYGKQVLSRLDTRQLLKDLVKKAKDESLRTAAAKRLRDIEAEARKPSPEKLRRSLQNLVAPLQERAQVLAVSSRWQQSADEWQRLLQKRDAALAEHQEVKPNEATAEMLAALDRAHETFQRRRREDEQRRESEAENRVAKETLLAEIQALDEPDQAALDGASGRWQAIGSAGDADAELDAQLRELLRAAGASSIAEAEPASTQRAPQAPPEPDLNQDQLDRAETILTEAEALVEADGAYRDRDFRYKELDKALRDCLGFVSAQHPLRVRFMDAYIAFKNKRREFREHQSQERQERCETMRALLSEAEALAEQEVATGPEPIKARREGVKDLQARWKEVGSVPPAMLGDLRERFRAACDRAFEPVHAFNQERDYELQAKVPEAEALATAVADLPESEPDPEARYHAVRDLQARWKRMGRLPRERNDDLWANFKSGCDRVYESLEAWFASRDEARERAQVQKEALLNELEDLIGASGATTRSDIADRIVERTAAADALSGGGGGGAGPRVKEIQELWKEIGPAPRAVDQELWTRYKKTLDRWYAQRREEFAVKDAERTENLHRKTALCLEAEEIAAAIENFKSGQKIGNKTEADFLREIKDVQLQWRTIGHVPRENFEAIQGRLKSAQDRIYGVLEDYFQKQDEERRGNLAAKEALLREIEELLQEERPDWFKDEARSIQQKWREVGPVPRDAMEIADRFRAACDQIFNSEVGAARPAVVNTQAPTSDRLPVEPAFSPEQSEEAEASSGAALEKSVESAEPAAQASADEERPAGG